MAMSLGACPAGNGEPFACVNPPLPSPSRIVTLLLCSLATAISGLPSLLRSAISTLPGAVPTGKCELLVAIREVTPEDGMPQLTANAADSITAKINLLVMTSKNLALGEA